MAQFQRDTSWHRAEVLSREGDTADVCFVDYGTCTRGQDWSRCVEPVSQCVLCVVLVVVCACGVWCVVCDVWCVVCGGLVVLTDLALSVSSTYLVLCFLSLSIL